MLNALSQMASTFRTRIGESLGTIKQHNTPLAAATTSSLEALKAYSAGLTVALSSHDEAASVPLFQRAIGIDPTFAMAHAFLGRVYGDLGESVLSAASTTRAYELRGRASDAERFFITASYDTQVTGNLENARQTCELWVRTYPRDVKALTFLSAFVYQPFGLFDKSINVTEQSIAIDPDFFPGYINLAGTYAYLDRLEDAASTLQKAIDRKLENPFILIARYQIDFLKADHAAMDRDAALGREKPGMEGWWSDQESLVLAYSGRLQQARTKSRKAVDSAQQDGHREVAALFETAAALREAFVGNASEARRSATATLDLAKTRDVEYGAAVALALAGDSSRVETIVNDLETRFPQDTSVRSTYAPTLRALLALNHGEPSRAIEQLQAAARYELGAPMSSLNGSFGALYPVYARGLIFLTAHQGVEAAAEFQKVLDHRGIVANDPIGAVARVQLARALALAADKTKAKAAYEDFFTLWNNADPDIPILVQARAEYAGLK